MPRKGWFKKAKAKFEKHPTRRLQYNAKSTNRMLRRDLHKTR